MTMAQKSASNSKHNRSKSLAEFQFISLVFPLLLSLFLAGCGDDNEATRAEGVIEVGAILLDKSTLELKVGEEKKLNATIAPESAGNKNIRWESDNPQVATVDENGLVHAVSQGKAAIRAISEDSNKTANCTVTVVLPVESLSLECPATMVLGSQEPLRAVMEPPDNIYQALSWTSDAPEVATVDENGLVHAVAEGTATIGVSAQDKTALCALRVLPENGPAIIGFAPLRAPHSATVEIFGSNFSAEPSENRVTLNGIPAVVLAARVDKLDIQVPKNMNCTGPLKVVVNGRTVTANTEFTYVPTATVSALVNSPIGFSGIVIGGDGNFYVSDIDRHRIFKVTTEGTLSLLAGKLNGGFQDGTGAEAAFNRPRGLTTDADGFLYLADENNSRIRKITLIGEVSTVTNNINKPYAIVEFARSLYVANNHRIQKVSLGGIVTPFAGSETAGFADGTGINARFNSPSGITIDAAGNLYVADTNNHRIRKVTPEGVVTTLAGSETSGHLDGIGSAAQFSSPRGIAVDKRGYLYVADMHRVLQVTPSGAVITLAGAAAADKLVGPGSNARFRNIYDMTINAAGDTLYVAETSNNRVYKIALE